MHPARTGLLLCSTVLIFSLRTSADEPKAPAPPPLPIRHMEPIIVSPEVNEDHTVTFRLKAPLAQKVEVSLAIPKDGNLPMTKADDGVWSVTSPALEPDVYEYSMMIDGARVTDPGNGRVKPAAHINTSIFIIPGKPPLVQDWQEVPHGAVTIHGYKSKAVGRVRRVVVYTPPGYLQDTGTKYPTLYLFHGSGDNEGAWVELGRAHMILDNLIAEGKAKPMLVVMPDGHAVTQHTGGVAKDNLAAFEKDLLGDVMPLVESNYRVIPDAAHRAIIGLSMGGGQSMMIGINHPDTFAWIGGMSSYVPDAENTIGPSLSQPDFGSKVKLLWFAIGKADFLLEQNKAMDAFLTSKGAKHEFVLTEGGHQWPVWRKYLTEFVPMIFQ